MTPSSLISQNNGGKIIPSGICLLFISLWMATGCTSKHARKTSAAPKKDSTLTILSDTSQIRNLISLAPTRGVPFSTGGVYIDSVKKVIHNHKAGLLIHGNLPSGCSNLLSIDHTTIEDTLHLHMTSWKPKDKMCTQQLVPFTYLYYPNMSVNDLEKIQFCNVNGQIIPFKP